jgi:hypothetical protein
MQALGQVLRVDKEFYCVYRKYLLVPQNIGPVIERRKEDCSDFMDSCAFKTSKLNELLVGGTSKKQ